MTYIADKGYMVLDNATYIRDIEYMAQRKKMRVGTGEIADAVKLSRRTVLRQEKKGEFLYGDLVSVSRYVVRKVGA